MTNKYEWLNKDSRKFLERGYLLEGETAEKRIRDIAEAAEKYLNCEGFADKFEDYMSRGFFSLSSPIWSNFGRKRGLPISCFGSYIPDTMEGIMEKVSETAVMTKHGGGTSAYFGGLRGRGTPISSGGESTGSVHFMELFDKLMNVVSQGNVRRGSFAAYLPIDHPDIEEFLKIKSEGCDIQDISIGVSVSDEWMKKMIDGDKDTRKIWGLVIKKRFESGYPYILFSDNVNNQAPQIYKDKGLKINNSNLCVTGDQRIPSNFGILTAKELYDIGKELTLFDNNKIVKSSPMRLIENNADVFKITLENGMTHKITSYHKVSVFDKRTQKTNEPQVIITRDVACEDLKIGDSVAIQTKKGLFGDNNMPKEAFLLGLYQADGTQHKDFIMIDLWENDFDILNEVQSYHDYVCNEYKTQISSYNKRIYENPIFRDCVVQEGSSLKKRLTSKALKKALNFEKGYVPDWIWSSNEETQWQYIKGLYYADGTVFKSKSDGEPVQISLASINKEFLEEIQIILANLGMQTSIRILREAGKTLLPDGKGGKKHYECKDCYRLIIGNKNDALVFEKNTSFLSRKKIKIEEKEYRNNTKKFYKVQSIEYVGKEDVYCVSVDSEEHHWVCNGFITHNCSEIMLSNSEDESFVCDLSSLNLETWEEWTSDTVEVLVYFLDAVMSEFIEKTEGMKFMEAPRKFAINQRALGVGVLGWHSLLQSKMIPFESMEAKILNNQIWKLIREKSDNATWFLAQTLGKAPIYEGTEYARRNTTTLAVAPTTSSSFILGQVSPSIEPLNSNYYVKDLAKGKFTNKNPHLKNLLKEKGKHDDDTWKSILVHGGSVQHLDFLSDNEKEVFKTFGEISQKEIIIQAAQRQKYIDQGQSLNIMIPPNTKPKDVNELMIFAWEQGIKSLYYQRSANPAQELARSIMTCKSCEA
jgi:ribonucleoside-diphosphate reductase alpha chain